MDFPIPLPTIDCQRIPKEQLIRQFQILGDILNAGTLLIDVRRTDYEGGCIRGSLNMPAQSFPFNMAALFRLCQGDGLSVISRVVFYCGRYCPLREMRFSP
jgi:arsenical-resistance protein 2